MVNHRHVPCDATTLSQASLDRPTLERICDTLPDPMALVSANDMGVIYCNLMFMDLCGLRPNAAKKLIAVSASLADVLRVDTNSDLIKIIRKSTVLHQSLGAESVPYQTNNLPEQTQVLSITSIPIDAFEDLGSVVLVRFRNTTSEHRVQSKYQRLLAVQRQHADELEQKVLERTRELAETQEELLHATRLAAIGEVAGSAAHEVLNPLTAVAGNLDSLRRSIGQDYEILDDLKATLHQLRLAHPTSDESVDHVSPVATLQSLSQEWTDSLERRRKVLDIVYSASRRIERIVQSMLGLSRIETEPEILELTTVFREVRDLMAYSFERSQVELSIEKDLGQSIYTYADRGELLQVLTNLLRNACQAARAANGPGEAWVKMNAQVSAQTVHIYVEDNGVGIPENLRARIFESGFTTKPRGEGSGLGLPISRRLIRRNSGDLVLHASTPGQGTTMLASLPLVHHQHSQALSPVKENA